MNRRLLLGAFGLGPFFVANSARADEARAGVVTQTLLKAVDGRREALGRFLTSNWLVMDRAGIEAGIFTHAVLYQMLDDPDCDFVVEVGYVDPRGYTAIAARFDAIRVAHVTVLVDGLGLADLGRITGDRSYRSVARA